MAEFDYSAVADNNIITGTASADLIQAGPIAPQYAPNPQGKLQLIQDNDLVAGGLGNDTMSGGYGNDDFVFNFNVTSGNQFVDLHNITSVTVGGVVYNKPAATAAIQAWKNWDAALEQYVTSVGGVKVEESFTNSNPGNPRNIGTIDLVVGYNVSSVSITGEGHDVITDYVHNSVAKENDELIFNGLSNDPTAANYWDTFLDSAQVDGATVISWSGGSITLQGVQTTLSHMVSEGWVVFG